MLISTLILLPLLAFLVWVFNPANEFYDQVDMSPNGDIATNILSSSITTNFAAQLTTLGYDTFLSGEGPFTVFVPTDNAYSNLPAEILDQMKDPAKQALLREVMLHHVVKGYYDSSTFKDDMTFQTLQGEKMTLRREGKYWVINGYSYVEVADVKTTNGVIHLMTNYIIPESYIQR